MLSFDFGFVTLRMLRLEPQLEQKVRSRVDPESVSRSSYILTNSEPESTLYCCQKLSRFVETYLGVILTSCLYSILVKNAEPLDFWQLRQLHWMFLAGAPVSVKVILRQRHEPRRRALAAAIVCYDEGPRLCIHQCRGKQLYLAITTAGMCFFFKTGPRFTH